MECALSGYVGFVPRFLRVVHLKRSTGHAISGRWISQLAAVLSRTRDSRNIMPGFLPPYGQPLVQIGVAERERERGGRGRERERESERERERAREKERERERKKERERERERERARKRDMMREREREMESSIQRKRHLGGKAHRLVYHSTLGWRVITNTAVFS